MKIVEELLKLEENEHVAGVFLHRSLETGDLEINIKFKNSKELDDLLLMNYPDRGLSAMWNK